MCCRCRYSGGPLRHSRDTRAPCALYCLHRGPHAAQVAPPGFSKAIKSKVKAITCIAMFFWPAPRAPRASTRFL